MRETFGSYRRDLDSVQTGLGRFPQSESRLTGGHDVGETVFSDRGATMIADQQDNTKLQALGMPTAVLSALMLSFLCAVSYWSITHLLVRVMSVSRADDLLGGMWAVIATIFVYRNSRETTLRAAVSRLLATSLSFVLCLAYLLVFPFSLVGMVALIGIGAITMSLNNRPDEIITTAITTVVVMVVAALSPKSCLEGANLSLGRHCNRSGCWNSGNLVHAECDEKHALIGLAQRCFAARWKQFEECGGL